MLGIAASTVRGWIMRGVIHYETVGRDNFVSRRQFQRFIDDPASRPVRAYTRRETVAA